MTTHLSSDLLEKVFSPELRIGKLLATLDDLTIPQIAESDETMKAAFSTFKSEIYSRIKGSSPLCKEEFERRLYEAFMASDMPPKDFNDCFDEIERLSRFLFPGGVHDPEFDYRLPRRHIEDLTLLLLPQFKSPRFRDLSCRVISALERRGAEVEYELSPTGEGYLRASITLNPVNPWLTPPTLVLQRPRYEMGRVTHLPSHIEVAYTEGYRPILDALTRDLPIRGAQLHCRNRFSELLEPELTGRGPMAGVIEEAVGRLVSDHGFDLSGVARLIDSLDTQTREVTLGTTTGYGLEDQESQLIRLRLFVDQRNNQGEVSVFSLVLIDYIPSLSQHEISGGYFTFTYQGGRIGYTAESGNIHRHLALMARLERNNPYGDHLNNFVRETLKGIAQKGL